MDSASAPRVIGSYRIFDEIAAGGMATVHLARHFGSGGFARLAAVKRLHPNFAKDPEFAAMLLDEARIAARIRHPNVVPTLDVVAEGGELVLVMEYVEGESLARLAQAAKARGQRLDPGFVAAVMVGVLHGLHAAHEATGERGEALGVVHRDVSPQNVMVGVDGVPRLLDFGVAKAAGRMQVTRQGEIKGKPRYMPPEQLLGHEIDRRADIYAAAVVLWEMLTGQRMIDAADDRAIVVAVFEREIDPPSRLVPGLAPVFDDVIARGLAKDPALRFPTAEAMAAELERGAALWNASAIGAWVREAAAESLSRRAALTARIEATPASVSIPPSPNEDLRASAAGTPSSTGAEPSSISIKRAARRRRSGWMVPAVAALGGAALAGVAALAVQGQSAATAAAPAASPALVAESAPPSAPASAPAVEPAPSAVPVATAEPGASAEASAAVQRSHAATPSRRVRSGPPHDCSPPYTVDAQGIHHMKPACL
jgi:eukaryotic-like serine/threonine-protein kinase